MGGNNLAPDWAKLKTNTGDASWVPAALDALRQPWAEGDEAATSARRRALRGLTARLLKGGRWLSAAPAVAASVAELIVDGAAERHRLLVLLARLVAVNPAAFLVDGFDLCEGPLAKRYARGTAKKVHVAAWGYYDEIVALLRDEDARVRSGAAYALLFHGVDRIGTAEAVAAAMSDETEPSVLLTYCHVLGQLDRATHQGRLSTLAEHADDAVAGMAALASGIPVDEAVRGRLVALVRRAPFDPDDVPLDDGRVDMLTARCLEARPEGSALAADVLMASLAEPHSLADEWAAGVLALEFGTGPAHEPRAQFLTQHTYFSPDRFSEAQRARLVELSEHPWAAPFTSYGVPFKLRDRRRWLGLDDPGVLEQDVEIEVADQRRVWPLWRWLHELQKGSQDRFEVLDEVLPPATVLAAQADAAMNAYGLRTVRAGKVAARARALGDEGVAWARQFAVHLASAVERDENGSFAAYQTGAAIKPGHPVAAVALEIMVEAGDELDPRYDGLIPSSHVALLEAIPLGRREAVVLRDLAILSRAPDLCRASLSFFVAPMLESLPSCVTPQVTTAFRALDERLRACERVAFEDREAMRKALVIVAS